MPDIKPKELNDHAEIIAVNVAKALRRRGRTTSGITGVLQRAYQDEQSSSVKTKPEDIELKIDNSRETLAKISQTIKEEIREEMRKERGSQETLQGTFGFFNNSFELQHRATDPKQPVIEMQPTSEVQDFKVPRRLSAPTRLSKS